MTLNPPRKVRAAIYILTAIGAPVATYLLAKGVIGDLEMTLWAAVTTVVNALAFANTTTK